MAILLRLEASLRHTFMIPRFSSVLFLLYLFALLRFILIAIFHSAVMYGTSLFLTLVDLMGMCLSITLLNDSHQCECFASAATELSSDNHSVSLESCWKSAIFNDFVLPNLIVFAACGLTQITQPQIDNSRTGKQIRFVGKNYI